VRSISSEGAAMFFMLKFYGIQFDYPFGGASANAGVVYCIRYVSIAAVLFDKVNVLIIVEGCQWDAGCIIKLTKKDMLFE